MILHEDYCKWTEEFISLKYDVDKVTQDMYEERLNEHAPYWSKITEYDLRSGNKSHGIVLSRAMELCKKETGVCLWPNIPEKYWEQAYNEIIGDM